MYPDMPPEPPGWNDEPPFDRLEEPPDVDDEYLPEMEDGPFLSPAPDDTRFVGLEQRDEAGQPQGYEIGCISITGPEIQYLPIQAFQMHELAQAEDLFDRLTTYVSEKDLAPQELPDLAEKAAARITERAGLETPMWRGLTPDEEWQVIGTPDLPPDYAQEELLRTAYEVGGVTDHGHPAIQALHEIGLSASDFDPDTDPPPFYDEVTQTAYWIGVYQPDPQDRETCVASILSLTRDSDTGAYAAQLAPCVVGDWDKAYQASDYLIGIAQRSDDIERVFEAAEGMAIATDQRQDWQHERGLSLELESAEAIGNYAAQQWELEL